uniref:Adropin n=1 Tax=Salarias fasciatus TaxID=181472 RepID=A0A672HC64_SALFA
MESEDGTAGLSTAALVAIGCNAFVAVLLVLLCLILYRACRVPSSPERLPVLDPSEAGNQQTKEHKYLLTS